jgi:hypothetical protein
MKIGIVSLYTNEIEDIVKLTAPNQKKYADTNGYDYILYKGRLSNRHPAWDKILAVKENLPNYDYVMWVDSDSIFKKFDYKLEDIILPEYNGFFGKDPVDSIYVNTGVFILKNSEWSLNLLNQVWDSGGKICGKIDVHSYKDWPYEQGPICDILKKDKENHYIVPNYMINCHPYFDNDISLIIHYMGCRTDEQTYKDTLLKIENYNEKLNVFKIDLEEINTKINKDQIKGNVIHSGEFIVEYNNIKGIIKYEIHDNNLFHFEYTLPKNENLSHIFKINNSTIPFNSDKIGCFEIPDEFELYHSYDWFGDQDFKYINTFNLKT